MKRYAFAGASARAIGMYARPMVMNFAQSAKPVGVFDVNPLRAALLSQATDGIPVFTDFDALLRTTRPDCVIVTTVDRYHHEYIIRALEAGCDVITEKPMTIDDEKCRAILAAEANTGRTVTVTFNYRFSPYVTRIKEILRSGAIGKVHNIDFEWLLDRSHGADYFRRWHRRRENSGGLMVHKATHHFDLINWWLDDEPQTVFGLGARHFYGPTRAERGERCSTCDYTKSCEFYVDFAARSDYKALYFDAEQADGYQRDGCVFSEEIDIEDTMNVTVRYKGGTQMSYSLMAYSPYEGWRIAFTGSEGRLEAEIFESGPRKDEPSEQIRVYNRQRQVTTIDLVKDIGGHGGGDPLLLRRLFGAENLPDPLGHMAGSWAGAISILVGIAANKSFATGQAVQIENLLK